MRTAHPRTPNAHHAAAAAGKRTARRLRLTEKPPHPVVGPSAVGGAVAGSGTRPCCPGAFSDCRATTGEAVGRPGWRAAAPTRRAFSGRRHAARGRTARGRSPPWRATAAGPERRSSGTGGEPPGRRPQAAGERTSPWRARRDGRAPRLRSRRAAGRRRAYWPGGSAWPGQRVPWRAWERQTCGAEGCRAVSRRRQAAGRTGRGLHLAGAPQPVAGPVERAGGTGGEPRTPCSRGVSRSEQRQAARRARCPVAGPEGRAGWRAAGLSAVGGSVVGGGAWVEGDCAGADGVALVQAAARGVRHR